MACRRELFGCGRPLLAEGRVLGRMLAERLGFCWLNILADLLLGRVVFTSVLPRDGLVCGRELPRDGPD